ncbi:MAG: endonuclease/exonuclease/phosphatase family protein, partial [Longimicrobiales bacterium]
MSDQHVRDRLAFALVAAVFLFLSEALRAFFGVLFAGFYDALFPAFNPIALLVALIPLLALLAPVLPMLRLVDRDQLVAFAAGAAALARIGLCFPALAPRAVFSALVLACCAAFIVAATGSLSRRIYAAGAATGLVLDQVLRLSGRSYDLTLRPQWLPAQLAIAVVVIMIALAFRRTPELDDETDHEERLERRAGGLRLRGAISIGCILFLESTVIGMPEVVARLTGVAYDLVGFMLVLAGAAAVAVMLGTPGPAGRQRSAAIGFAGLAAVAAVTPFAVRGWPAVLIVAAAHFALLVLIYRALAPAGGRRGGWVVAVGLGALVLFQLLYGFTFFYSFTIPAFQGRAPVVLAAAGLLLFIGLFLTPRPNASRPRSRRRLPLVAAGVVLLVLALRLGWREEPAPILPTAASTFRIATYNVHYGFNMEWRYDPEAIARALEASAADVIVLQEVTAGVPSAYGTDLALWLGRRLRMQSIFAPTINGLLGDAFLTRLPILAFDSQPLPPDTADRKQLGRLTVRAGSAAVTVFGTHLSVRDAERRVQIAAALPLMGQIAPAVLAGDLNDTPDSIVLARLMAGGFRSAFDVLGQPHMPTAPSRSPRETIDYILVRELQVETAEVLT